MSLAHQPSESQPENTTPSPAPILDAQVSLFDGSYDTTVQETVSLGTVLARIQDGVYRPYVEQLRRVLSSKGEKAYKLAKEKSIAFTPCCSMTTRDKDTPWPEKLLACTGLVHLDCDSVEDSEALKAHLAQHPAVVFAFVSPRGKGVTVGVAATGIEGPDSYKHAWAVVVATINRFCPDVQVSLDENVKYLGALCYMSYDAAPVVNADATPIAIPPPQPPPPKRPPPRQRTAEDRADYARVMQALDAIPNQDASYEDWLDLGIALHSTGQSWARSAWDDWSRQSDKYDEGKQSKSWRSFREDGKTTIATLFHMAKDHGGRPPRTPRSQNAPRPVPDMTGATAEAHQDPHGGNAPPTGSTPAHGSSADEDYPYSDAFNALRLIRAHGQNIRYCAPWHSWLTWTGTHWQRDTTGVVMRWQRHTVKALGAQVPDLDDDDAKKLMGHIKSSLNTARLKAAVDQAHSWDGMTIAHEALDAEPWLLNVANGTLDLHSGTLRPHRQTDLLTRCLTIPYAPDVACPTWDAFLWRIMGGRQDPDDPDMSVGELERRRLEDERPQGLIGFLQRAIGYTLTGCTHEQCLFILHGPTKTGKSTFLATLRALLGPYGQQADMDSFMHKDRQEVRNDIADLAGSRCVCALESQHERRLAENLVKQMTGGADQLKARFLFQEHFTFKPQFKIFLGTNHKPVIKDTDSAIWERIRLVPFTVQIPKPERVKTLDEQLQAELPGILAWAVRGCLDWQRRGELGEPEAVIEATAGYRREMDDVGRFLSAVCLLGQEHYKTKASVLLKAYHQWCGQTTMTGKAFAQQLTDKGYTATHGMTGNFWHGIGLPSDMSPDQDNKAHEGV